MPSPLPPFLAALLALAALIVLGVLNRRRGLRTTASARATTVRATTVRAASVRAASVRAATVRAASARATTIPATTAPTATVPATDAASARLLLRRTRLRMLASALALVLVFGVVWSLPGPAFPWNSSSPPLYGVPQAVAPLLATVAALLVLGVSGSGPFGVNRRAPERTGIRSAQLTPRSPADFDSRWGGFVLAVAAMLLVLFLATTAATAAQLDLLTPPSYIAFFDGTLTQATPYPGWPYGLVIVLASVLLVAATFFAIRRIAAAARPVSTGLYELDTAARGALSRFVALLGIAATTATLGAAMWVAGHAIFGASNSRVFNEAYSGVEDGVPLPPDALYSLYSQPGYAMGIVIMAIGVALVVVSTVLLVSAASTARLRFVVASPTQPASRPDPQPAAA